MILLQQLPIAPCSPDCCQMEKLGSSQRANSPGCAYQSCWHGRNLLFGALPLLPLCRQRGQAQGHAEGALLRHLIITICGVPPKGLAGLHQGCYGFLVQAGPGSALKQQRPQTLALLGSLLSRWVRLALSKRGEFLI